MSLNRKHGMKYHPLYSVYKSMIERCYKPEYCPNFRRYGARGISVCEEWRENRVKFFDWALSHGWARGLQLDRENNDGNYSPENCRFVTQIINLRNRRDRKLSLADAAVVKSLVWLGVPHKIISALYNVRPSCVGKIGRGERWKDVDAYIAGQAA